MRIRCDATAPCRVYLACDSVGGAHFFGRLAEPVGMHAVRTVTAIQLAETIGATDADFVGGMSCELLGEDISVQVLVRSGGTLANHTHVAGFGREAVGWVRWGVDAVLSPMCGRPGRGVRVPGRACAGDGRRNRTATDGVSAGCRPRVQMPRAYGGQFDDGHSNNGAPAWRVAARNRWSLVANEPPTRSTSSR